MDWIEHKKESEMQDPSKKYGKGFPIEDSQLIGSIKDSVRPSPCYDFGEIDVELIPDFMTIWNFLCIFRYYTKILISSQRLKVSFFTFEEFKTCITFKSNDFLPDIIAESFSALLAIACTEWSSKTSSTTGLASSTPVFTKTVSVSSSVENLTPVPTDSSIQVNNMKVVDQLAFEELYESLTIEEKAAIDQWWKWTPEKWMTKDKRKTKQITVHDRYKAWEIALAGLIKDWMSIDDFPEKYSFLISLFEESQEVEVNEIIETEIQDEETPELAQESSLETEKNAKDDFNDTGLSDEDSDSQSSQSSMAQYSLRKKRRIINDEPDVETEDGQSESVRKSRRKNTPSKMKLEPNSASKTSSTGKATKLDGPVLEFSRLCKNAERSFAKTSVKERILILLFLVHKCVEPSVYIHSYIEESAEKIRDLKRNQRDLIKDRKLM